MGTKQVTGSSLDGLVEAFAEVMAENPPPTTAGCDYTVVGWRAQAGGAVGRPIYYVDVEISGPDVE